MQNKRLVIGIYYHPEAYPPTLNAVTALSGTFESISMVYRPNLQGTWQYPSNVKTIASGDFITAEAQAAAKLSRKLSFFKTFAGDLKKECLQVQPSLVLLYDPLALFAYSIIKKALKFPHLVWYHNHDIWEISRTRKYSIGWFACRAESKLFPKLDIFTLPSAERLQFFPMNELKGKTFVIPNYPSRSFYNRFYKPKQLGNEIKLIFQGRIYDGLGLEQVIPVLSQQVHGRELSLVLKGYCDADYKQRLITLAASHKVEHKLSFAGFTPYEEVPKLAASCHIGLGIFANKQVMHLTLGTASNKLYEYAAVGLPVIYLNEEHFVKHLGKFNWAFPVELTPQSILAQVATIAENYAALSAAAHESFETTLNFEHHFQPVIDYLSEQ